MATHVKKVQLVSVSQQEWSNKKYHSPKDRKIRIILHPKNAMNQAVRDAVQDCRAEGYHIDVRVAWETDDIERFAIQAVTHDGIDVVVAGGGDGTLNSVVKGILESGMALRVSLAILPLGTGNDFANCCGIPLNDPKEALSLIIHTDPRLIDLGLAGDRFFINLATGGFGTQVTTETSPELKRILGSVSYLLTGINQISTIELREARITAPDFEWKGRFYAFAVGNGQMAGGGVLMCPKAVLDDGLLDITIIKEFPIENTVRILGEMLRSGVDPIDHVVLQRKFPWVKVDAPKGLQINLDGEPISATNIEFRAMSNQIFFHLPPQAPLKPVQAT